jgi:predicted Zn finger-like uncharacterized protein
MYTQCPYCQTCFRVADAHLKAAKGKVRCGSCKEIFDATEHLYEGVPGSDNKIPIKPPAAKPQTPTTTKPATTAPEPTPRYNEISPGGPEIPEHEHEHIDLTAPPDRSDAPDQSQFMESIMGEYSRYNNLDEMGSIKIPGGEDFTDSIIKKLDDTEENLSIDDTTSMEEEEIAITNPYADTDSQEEPATTQERDGINALYTAADDQMFEEDASEQLDKDIEALLGDDFTFDDDEMPAKAGTGNDAGVKDRTSDESAGFSGMDSIRFNVDADIPLKAGDEPKLVPNENDVEPLDVVSSEDIWAKKQGASKENKTLSSNTADTHREKADIEFGDSFLDLESSSFKSEGELEFEEEIEHEPEPVNVSEPEIDIEPEPEVETATKAPSVEDDLPSFEHDIPRALRSSFENYESPMRPIGLTIAMLVGIIVLVIALFTQVILFRSYQLANQVPALEPMLTALCGALPCRYSGSIDLSKIEVLNRDMRSHPTQKNALLVSAAIVNKAKFDQPYPIIAIKLFDLSGDTVATRYFKPSEYLENLYSKFLLMESGTPVHITLAILDPGDDAVNFEISFK